VKSALAPVTVPLKVPPPLFPRSKDRVALEPTATEPKLSGPPISVHTGVTDWLVAVHVTLAHLAEPVASVQLADPGERAVNRTVKVAACPAVRL
jgi:hypothetical protein